MSNTWLGPSKGPTHIVGAVRFFVRGVLRIFGVQIDPDSHIMAVREEIVGALQIGHSEGVVEKEDRDRILGALDLSDRFVEEIMLHRSKIEMIDAEADPEAILEQCLTSSHTRLPLFRKDQENIVLSHYSHHKYIVLCIQSPKRPIIQN